MLHVHEWGDPNGEPVICLHGVMGDGGRFRRLAADRLGHRRVLAPDLRGHGRSTWNPPWDIDTHLDDLRATLDTHGVTTPADVVGFSFGGRLAVEFAATDPSRVRRLVLLDPALKLPPDGARDAADASRHDEFFATVEDAVKARQAHLDHTPEELLREDLALSLTAGDDGRLGYAVSRSSVVAAYGEMATTPRLPEPVPTLVVRASHGVFDDDQRDLLRRAIGPALTELTVPGAHPVMWDAYPATADAVAAHLAERR